MANNPPSSLPTLHDFLLVRVHVPGEGVAQDELCSISLFSTEVDGKNGELLIHQSKSDHYHQTNYSISSINALLEGSMCNKF